MWLMTQDEKRILRIKDNLITDSCWTDIDMPIWAAVKKDVFPDGHIATQHLSHLYPAMYARWETALLEKNIPIQEYAPWILSMLDWENNKNHVWQELINMELLFHVQTYPDGYIKINTQALLSQKTVLGINERLRLKGPKFIPMDYNLIIENKGKGPIIRKEDIAFQR